MIFSTFSKEFLDYNSQKIVQRDIYEPEHSIILMNHSVIQVYGNYLSSENVFQEGHKSLKLVPHVVRSISLFNELVH